MSSTLTAAIFFIVVVATQVAVTHWLFTNVLELPSKRPWRAASASVVLTCLTVGPAVAGFDTLLGHSLSDVSRFLLAIVLGVLQTGLVLRLLYRTSLLLSMGHGLVLQLTWSAMGLLLVFLGDVLGTSYTGAPLVLFAVVYAVKRFQDRELTRLMDSIPPVAPSTEYAPQA